jgi:hypothetical protein
MKKTTRARSGVALTFICLAGCTAKEPAPAPTAAASIEAIATTRQIMLGITIPTSDILFGVATEAPKDDAAWERVQANALALAESANLLTIGSRVRDEGDWLKHCQALIETAKLAAQAAQEKNIDKELEAGDRIYEVCDACHRQYMPARQGQQG